jgi:spore maturation protein A
MLNAVWLFLLAVGIIMGIATGNVQAITDAAVEYSQTAVELSLGLIGIMALWLGIMKIAEESDLIKLIAKGLKPIMVKLFPDVPPEHPAMGAMIMNLAANVLGLNNAATPLGIKAMKELQTLNTDKPETASNAMCTFLAINTASVTLVASSLIGYRVAAGSKNPTEIIGPSLIATLLSAIVAVIVVKTLEKIWVKREKKAADTQK